MTEATPNQPPYHPPPPPPAAPGVIYPLPPNYPTAAPSAEVSGMPKSVKAARVVLLIGTGISLMLVVAAILMGQGPTGIGYVVGSTLPGWLGLVVALRLHTGKRLWWVLALVVVGLGVLGALGTFGRGDVRGLTQMLLPVATLVLMLQPASMAFFAKKA